jgi:fructokinase
MSGALLAAIEGGGTKFVCAVGTAPNDILQSITVQTAEPEATLDQCGRFFEKMEDQYGSIAAVGFGCFGPLDLRPQSNTYGHLLTTPKPGWSGVDLLRPLRSKFQVPIVLDTDVAAAAIAELQAGSPWTGSLAYVTVGTGIGGGVAPRPHGRELMHPEMGHLRVRRDGRDLVFRGVCPFHGDCLEGLASGPAIVARWSRDLSDLPRTHEAWSILGGYLGQLAAAIALLISVERIVFGGGVANNPALLSEIRAAARDALNGYLSPLNDQGFERYICAPVLGNRAGIIGAMLLASQALSGARRDWQ